MSNSILKNLNVFEQCRKTGLSLWQCPPFLFVVMGMVDIISIIGSYFIAIKSVDEPQVAALAVIAIGLVIFIIGNAIIFGFNKVVEANQRESEFIAIISHQLRSPLSIFKWTLNSLKEESAKQGFSEESRDSIKTLYSVNQGLIRLVDTLLEVHRIESNRFSIKKKNIDLKTITEDIISAHIAYAKSMDIDIHFSVHGKSHIFADENKMQIVVENLIDNAIRYSKQHSAVMVSMEETGKKLLWKVSDQGLGIAAEDQKYIFQKFFRAGNAIRYQVDGNGIGLYITKTIIQGHGGTIGFSSKENGGATFWFTLPQ